MPCRSATGDLRHRTPKGCPPVLRREAGDGPGAGRIENAVPGAARRSRILLGRDGLDDDLAANEVESPTLLADRHREVEPARRAVVGPVEDALDVVPVGDRPGGPGRRGRGSRGADLIGDYC